MKRRVLAGLVLAFAAAGTARYAWIPRPAMAELQRELPQRSFVGRLSMDVKYHACTPDPQFADSLVQRQRCAPAGDFPVRLSRLLDADAIIDPDSLHASALTFAIWARNEDKALFTAVERLHQALGLRPDSVALLADASAVYLLRAERMQNPRDLLEALDKALRALTLDPSNLVALFNAALAAEALTLDGQAVQRWSAYLAVDSTTRWAEEARERRAALLQLHDVPPLPTTISTPAGADSVVRLNAQHAWTVGFDSVLVKWGRAVLAGDSAAADAHLRVARLLGEALERRKPAGNVTLADAVRAINSVRANPAATRRLAAAHEAFGVGNTVFQARPDSALRRFNEALQSRPASRVLVLLARLNRAAALAQNRMPGGADSARSLLRQIDAVRYPSMMARALWVGGNAVNNRSPSTATGLWNQVSDSYRLLGEWENDAGVRSQAIWELYTSGDTTGAYRSAHEILRQLRSFRGSIRLVNQLTDLASWARGDEMEHAALAVQQEAFAVAARTGVPPVMADAFLARAQSRMEAGQRDSALQDVGSAAALVNRPDFLPLRKTEFEAKLTIARAITGAGDNRDALMAALDTGMDSVGLPVWRRFGWMARADINLEAGNLADAGADLDSLGLQIRAMSGNPRDVHLRAAMIEQLRARIDRLAMLHVRARRPVEALRAVEDGRLSFSPGADSVPARIGWTPPREGQVLLSYAMLGNTVVTFVVRHDSTAMLERPVNRDSLLLTIQRTNTMLEARAGDRLVKPLLIQLYDELIAPVRHRLNPCDSTLVIVADGEIAGVPFAALLDSRRDRFLVEDYALRHATSLADASRPGPPAPKAALAALLIGNPEFSGYEVANLGRLPHADEEVAALAGLYPRSVTLRGSHATRDSLRARAPGMDVIHYAGHAVFDDARPERSFLVLAGSNERPFTADSVGALDLRGVRLVVLSACRTLRARQGRSGGFAGFSGAMLEAGAGGVVGSLWDADDELTKGLMIRFHGQYRRSGDPAHALRQAQLGMLRSEESAEQSIAAWSGFRYMGR